MITDANPQQSTGRPRTRWNREKGTTLRGVFEGVSRFQEMIFWGALVVAVQVFFTVRQHQHTAYRGTDPVSMQEGADALKAQFQGRSETHRRTSGNTTAATSLFPQSRHLVVGRFNGVPIYNLRQSEISAAAKVVPVDKQQRLRRTASSAAISTPPPLYSQVHCTGDTYMREVSRLKMDAPWMSRSCEFRLLCFDTHERNFVLFQDPTEQSMARFVQERPFLHVSHSVLMSNHSHNPEHNNTDSAKPYYLSLGGINLKWGHREGFGIPNLKWFPKIIEGPAPLSDLHMLPANVVLIPFHSLAAFNPGHLVWDDWLPIFTLLTMFQMDQVGDGDSMQPRSIAADGTIRGPFETPYEPLLIRMNIDNLWATCDWTPNGSNISKEKICAKMHSKFGPLITKLPIVTSNRSFVEMEEPIAQDGSSARHDQRRYVCAKQGLAGIGSLTDHGIGKGHGFNRNDYMHTHNVGRGGMLWKFRTYMMRQLNEFRVQSNQDPLRLQAPEWKNDKDHPFIITFSIASSGKAHRRLKFHQEIASLKKEFVDNPESEYSIDIQSYKMSDHSLAEQVEVMSQTAIHVTACGGGAVTASFLPRGAAILLLCHEEGGIENNRNTGLPARLDWDLFNSMSYIRVYWLPVLTRTSTEDQNFFIDLVRHVLGQMNEDAKRDGRK